MNLLSRGASLALLLLATTALAPAADVPLRFDRIDLTDGRTLRNVVVKSYDRAADKLLLVADGSAMLIPAGLVPAPFAARLREGAPPAGGSTAVVATRVVPPAALTAQTVPMPVAPAGDTDSAAERERLLARHKQAAAARALRYFRYEFQAGSSAISVTAVDIETDQPQKVQGWPGRYRTKGTARLEFYDSKGNSFSRSAGAFEVLTEEKTGEPMTVVAFMPK